jgi:hypothetical protein
MTMSDRSLTKQSDTPQERKVPRSVVEAYLRNDYDGFSKAGCCAASR